MSARNLVIRFTPEADDDYESISLYTWQTWGEKQAADYETKIVMALESLRDHPLLGQPRDDLFPGCRRIRVDQHAIYYYQPQPTEIVVLRILHGRRDASAEVEDPLR
jgi:toxin ParE1/3/4